MMFNNLSSTQRSSLAIGLMFFCFLTITFGIAMPLVAKFDADQDRVAQLQEQLQRYNSQISNRPDLMAQTAELKSTILASGVFSLQKSVPLVLAELQQKIKTLVTAANGELISTQNLPQTPMDGLIKLGIGASFSGKINELKQILYAFETAKPYMLLENIKIYGLDNQHGNPGKIENANKVMVAVDIVTFIPLVKK